jgi:hypothetical protein
MSHHLTKPKHKWILSKAAGRVVVVRFSSGRGAAALVSSGRRTEAAGRVVVVLFSSGIGAAALLSSGRLTEAAGPSSSRVCYWSNLAV